MAKKFLKNKLKKRSKTSLIDPIKQFKTEAHERMEEAAGRRSKSEETKRQGRWSKKYEKIKRGSEPDRTEEELRGGDTSRGSSKLAEARRGEEKTTVDLYCAQIWGGGKTETMIIMMPPRFMLKFAPLSMS